WRRRVTSSSLRSLTRVSGLMFAIFTIFSAVVRPMPVMYMSEMIVRFCGGMSTPAMRAIAAPLTLPLLVLGRLGADHTHHTIPPDHLAARTHLLDGRSYLHLQISRMRPRERSLLASSTPTLSPASSRVKWVPARSAT